MESSKIPNKIYRIEGELLEYLNERILQYLLKDFDDSIKVKEIHYQEEEEREKYNFETV